MASQVLTYIPEVKKDRYIAKILFTMSLPAG